jgi:hypothetical protein
MQPMSASVTAPLQALRNEAHLRNPTLNMEHWFDRVRVRYLQRHASALTYCRS